MHAVTGREALSVKPGAAVPAEPPAPAQPSLAPAPTVAAPSAPVAAPAAVAPASASEGSVVAAPAGDAAPSTRDFLQKANERLQRIRNMRTAPKGVLAAALAAGPVMSLPSVSNDQENAAAAPATADIAAKHGSAAADAPVPTTLAALAQF